MGCCCCSQVPILDDPTITAHLKVGRFIAVRGYTTYRNDAPGLLYTDGENLYYEPTCGDKRASCSLCFMFRQPLSSIKEITVEQGSQVVAIGNGVLVGPFLKVTFDNGVILASAADMGSFPQTLDSMTTKTMKPPGFI
uniref:Uncharacterized protein n=1 Tax=Amphimedon queenslandica TaxID=400682 RepID=A0A1X7TKL3_AMPQE